jgi:sugar lactone lactonase YvrE
LGEGPVWHAQNNALYFVDIKQHKVHRCGEDGGLRQSWSLPDEVGFALPMRGGDFVCGLPGQLMRFSSTRFWQERRRPIAPSKGILLFIIRVRM